MVPANHLFNLGLAVWIVWCGWAAYKKQKVKLSVALNHHEQNLIQGICINCLPACSLNNVIM